MPGLLVVIAGLDGVGKDFIAERLHDTDSGSTLLKTPTNPFASIRADLDGMARSAPAARYAFYLASVIHASDLIMRALPHGNVYCVRYLIDTVVYHRALGLTVPFAYDTDWYQLRR